ncbi:MAG: fucose isomerase [Armatimonadota bacterium]|nr:fucose isomerase [Armatimonadota bacterium]
MDEPVRVGVVSFTDPRSVDLADEGEAYNRKCHQELAAHLATAGFEIVDPLAKRETFFPIRSTADVDYCVHELRCAGAECVVLGMWKWTDPMLAVDLVRSLDLPTLLYCESDVNWTGLGLISAVGAGLWQIAPSHSALNHTRIRADKDKAVAWVRGVGALQKLRKSRLLLWGGSYCLRMEHLQDDVSKLKSFLVGDVLNESEYLLIRRAEDILKNSPREVDEFIEWLKEGGAQFNYDGRMLTAESFRTQVALYLAARRRLAELEGENIVGVSVHCQPALSEEYGVTGCGIPAFLPFGFDHRGRQPIINTTCEGDIKGLITSVMLSLVHGEAPAQFGDIREIDVDGKRMLVISNCGASSIYYAANSNEPEKALPKVRICPQCQGASGAAIGYFGEAIDKVTVARLVRIAGEYLLHVGVGRAIDVTKQMSDALVWGAVWPLTVVDLDWDIDRFVDVMGSNHYSMVPGDHLLALSYLAREAGIPIVRIDQ